jgi:glucosamine kinase
MDATEEATDVPDRPLVLGLDIGGSATRAVLVTTEGVRVAAGRAAGANPTAHEPRTVAEHLTAALRQALRDVDPSTVVAATLGVAGGGRLAGDARARAAFDRTWSSVGLACPYRLIGDALVAYVAGTAVPDGTVLIAGTGAIAASVRGYALARTADGHGWLLGDDGSGFWLGRAAVKATLAELDAGTELSALARHVVARLLGDETDPHARGTASALVQRVTAAHPIRLARLAPLVLRDAAAGDAAAARLVERAATLLSDTVALVRTRATSGPIVLAGGLLTSPNPLAERVRTRLGGTFPDAALAVAGDGAAAAAWLALRELAEIAQPRLVGLHAGLVVPMAAAPVVVDIPRQRGTSPTISA